MNLKDYGKYVEKWEGHILHYYHGKLHRTDGPAIEYANGNKRWYFNGQSCQDYSRHNL